MLRRSMSPKVTVSSIPSITALRRELDYGELKLPRCSAFNDDINAFRKKFITSRGVAGTDLFNWNSKDGQEGLAEITSTYLDEAGNGRIFWPDDESAANYNKYQYSTHESQIKRLVKQLFFRLNHQQHRNHKYKNKPSEQEPRQDEGLLQEEDIKCEPPDEPWEMTLRPYADQSDTGFNIGSDTEDSQSSVSSDEFPSLPAIFARNTRMDKKSSTVTLSSAEPPRQDLGSVDAGDEDIHSDTLSPEFLPRMDQPKFSHQDARRKKRDQSFEDAIGGQAQPKRQKQTKQAVEDVILLPNTPANRPQRRLQPRKPDEFVRDPDEINRRIDSDSGPQVAPDTPSTSRRQQPSVASHRKPRRVASGSEDSDGHPVSSASQVRNAKQVHSPQARITTFFRPPAFLNKSSEPLPQTTPPAVPEVLRSPPTSPTTARTSTAATPKVTTTATPHQPSVLFTYRLILTRHPHTATSRWAPAGGRFSDKTLAQLRRELPFPPDNPASPGLIFFIASQCMRTVERIVYDDEDGFEAMKRYISMEVGAWLGRRKKAAGKGLEGRPPATAERLVVDVLIERMPAPGSGEEEERAEGQGWLEEPEVVEW
ncbi:hypothetical protein OQA88_5873 [Cercophora sp. LCS_1]